MAGHTALVTGSGRNIGRAIALEFASRGANVVLNSRSNSAELAAACAEVKALGVGAIGVLGNASEKDVVLEMKRRGEEAFGHVDIYVSNAARRLHKDFFETDDDDWHEFLNQQLTACWYLAKAFVPAMCERGWGRVIHITGPDGTHGGWTRIPHSVAKGGIRTLTRSLASGLGQYGITVNDVVPGFIDTIRDPTTHPTAAPETTKSRLQSVPIKRQPTPAEVAWACAFLCSERSAALTGVSIPVNGGNWRGGSGFASERTGSSAPVSAN